MFWIGFILGILVGALAPVGVEKLKALINKA
jgi:hypothetical protein